MKSVLITGGTGTFGRRFVETVLEKTECERICIYSRGEHKQAEMSDNYRTGRLRFFIGDVRDRDRLRRAFEGVDVVVHAAALKRIEVGYYNPTEMIRTNVDGSLNVVEAAQDAGVRKVVLVSSDKAYQPVSPYGQTKALAESLFLAANHTVNKDKGPKFSVVRYGNVWKSAGSVVPKWQALRASGAESVPVTDPDCTRFFMTLDEAVQLVLDTIKTMQGGELNVPTLPAYRIGELAEAMGLNMTITGLPHWEKKHENMDNAKCSRDARRMSVEELRQWL